MSVQAGLEEGFRVIDLAAEADSSKGIAPLKDPTLEVVLPKVAAGG